MSTWRHPQKKKVCPTQWEQAKIGMYRGTQLDGLSAGDTIRVD